MTNVQEYYLRFVIVTDWVNGKDTIFSDFPIKPQPPPPIPSKLKENNQEPKTCKSEYKLQYYDYYEAQKLSSIPPPLPKRNKKQLLPQQMAPILPRRKVASEKIDYLPDMTPPPILRRKNGFRNKQKCALPKKLDNKIAEVKCDVIAYI